MNTPQFLAYLREEGVHLGRDGSRIRYDAPRGFVCAAVLDELRARKHELMELLCTEEERRHHALEHPLVRATLEHLDVESVTIRLPSDPPMPDPPWCLELEF